MPEETIPPREAPADAPEGQTEDSQPETIPPQVSPWKIMPVSLGFSLIVLAAYALSSYPVGFKGVTVQAAEWGAFIPDLVRQGEWWRIYSAALLHADAGHLFSNLFGLVAFGNILEPVLGPRKLLLLYFISQTIGMLFSMLIHPSISIGASGIDFGLIGAYVGLILLIRFMQDRDQFARDLRTTLILPLLFVIVSITEPHINVWAHLGGFLGGLGFVLGLILLRRHGPIIPPDD